MKKITLFAGLIILSATATFAEDAPKPPLGFFVTCVGLGKGADLGGLTGADAHCQKLATAVGAGKRTWRAYLSTQALANKPAINARDRASVKALGLTPTALS